MKKSFVKFLKLYFIAISVFLILLFIVWSMPDRMMKYNVEYSKGLLEDAWTPIFTYEEASTLDDCTDRLCIGNAIREGSNEEYNTFQAMLDVKNYARYWHGYLVVLKPALCLLNYLQIRYFNMFFFMVLISVVFTKMKERLGWRIALSFVIALCTTNVLIIPWSLQFSSVYYIMLFFILIIISFYNNRAMGGGGDFWKLSFFFVGMVTNFFDFLTAPLLTAGMPLCVIVLLELSDPKSEMGVGQTLYREFCYGMLWGIGYALCWVTKWIIASVVLQKNVLADAAIQAEWRSVGGDGTIADAILKNLKNLRLPNFESIISHWYGMILVIIVIIVAFGMLIAFHNSHPRLILPLALLAVMPYAWICVFKGHSNIHSFFVYRIQMITVFSGLCIYTDLFDWNTFKEKTQGLSKALKGLLSSGR